MQRCKDTECQHVNVPNGTELCRATGRLLQLPGASCSCAICAQLLVSTDVQSYPVSYLSWRCWSCCGITPLTTASEMRHCRRIEVPRFSSGFTCSRIKSCFWSCVPQENLGVMMCNPKPAVCLITLLSMSGATFLQAITRNGSNPRLLAVK